MTRRFAAVAGLVVSGIAPALRGGAMSIVACTLVAAHGACNRRSAAPAPSAEGALAKSPAPAVAAAATREPPRLPEDPAAGKRSEQQWREHLEEEEHERQLWFDRERLKEHRAVGKLIETARARYDRARTEAAVAKARTGMPPRIAELRRRVTKIDPWGNNSPLLADYDALAASLTAGYPDAKVAAIKGDPLALAAAGAAFDQRMKKIADWLEAASESEYE